MPNSAQIHRPRRQHSRLRLNMPATLATPEGEKRITLLNLSQGGARIRLSGDGRASGGVLKWMDNEAFGAGIWQRGPEMGLRFDDPIDWDRVVAARHWQPAGRVRNGKSAGLAGTDAPPKKGPSLDIHKLRKSGAKVRLARWVPGVLLLGAVLALGMGLWGGRY
ncbi:MAG: hypothetical protein J7493_07865 [Porphyrobacter sp.]|nr:hypothetical protein [Porphyrobacter sp.]